MDSSKKILFNLLFILFFGFIAIPQALSSVPKSLNVDLNLSQDSVIVGDIVSVDSSIAFNESIEKILVTISSNGVLQAEQSEQTFEGPWLQDDSTSFGFDFSVEGLNSGEINITIVGIDRAEVSRFVIRKNIFALSDGDSAWLSTSSLIDARIKRLKSYSNGKPGARQKTGQEAPESLDDIITVFVPRDHTEVPDIPFTEEEQKLQTIFDEQGLVTNSSSSKLKISARASATITVGGLVQWTDRNGKKHPLPMAEIEILDKDPSSTTVIKTISTNAAGVYSTSITYDDGAGGLPDIFVRAYARSTVADIKPDTASGTTYRMESPVSDNVAIGSSLAINLTAGNATDSESVFSIHHALVMIGAYSGNLAGTMPSKVVTRFPTTRSTSLFNGTELHILKGDRSDWDVIHHEYGHYFMSIHSIQDNPGGSHGFGDNLSQRRGSKDVGVRLAWGEGWPTYFGISGQKMMGASALNVPDVGDTHYQDTDDASIDLDLENRTGVGEDNEVSVMSALWDLFDSAEDGKDHSQFTDKWLFEKLKAATVKTVGAAWEAYAATQTTEEKTVMGGLFAQANIAPELTAPADNIKIKTGDTPPTFKWIKNGGGAANPLNDFKIKFYKSDFSSVIFEKSLGDVDEYTPTNAELATILGGDQLIKWVVEGKNTSAPATPGGTLGYYWSEARTIGGIDIVFVIDDTGSMGEEIDSVKSALVLYINAVEATLGAGDEPPTIQLITFKDSVTTRVTSNDLAAVRSAVNALGASGGGDCPEFSAHALDLASINISPGGTILFATDASSQPGVDIGALISRLTSKSVSVNTVLSGDCSGISSSKPGARLVNRVGESGDQGPTKPTEDGVDLPQGDIVDPGQPPIDDYSDDISSPSLMPLGTIGIRGTLGATPDNADVFLVPLEANKTYTFQFELENGDAANPVTVEVLDADKTTQLYTNAITTTGVRTYTFKPDTTGEYFVRLTRGISLITSAYSVKAYVDAFATLVDGIEMFSTISLETGGAFIVRDNVNSGNSEAYSAAVLNIMRSTIGPTVLFSSPEELPLNTQLTITLQGENTSWVPGKTSVSFSGSGITVQNVNVRASNLLDVAVKVDGNASLGYRDVTVVTNLGGVTESVEGVSVINVINEITTPTLLSVESSLLQANSSYTLFVRGINTNWALGSIVNLGSDITIDNVSVVSKTLIKVDVTVAADAKAGYRTASVDGQTKSRAIFVANYIEGFAHVDSASPIAAKRNQEIVIEVIGTSTNFDHLLTSATFGEGVSIVKVEVVDAQTAKVTIKVDRDARLGFRDIVLTTSSEAAVLLNGFLIQGNTVKDAQAVGAGPFAEPLVEEEKTAVRPVPKSAVSPIEVIFMLMFMMLALGCRINYYRK